MILSASIPFLSILLVVIPHTEATTFLYFNVMASAQLTILIVSNMDGTIIRDENASAVHYVVFVEFSKDFAIRTLLAIHSRVWLD